MCIGVAQHVADRFLKHTKQVQRRFRPKAFELKVRVGALMEFDVGLAQARGHALAKDTQSFQKVGHSKTPIKIAMFRTALRKALRHSGTPALRHSGRVASCSEFSRASCAFRFLRAAHLALRSMQMFLAPLA